MLESPCWLLCGLRWGEQEGNCGGRVGGSPGERVSRRGKPGTLWVTEDMELPGRVDCSQPVSLGLTVNPNIYNPSGTGLTPHWWPLCQEP